MVITIQRNFQSRIEILVGFKSQFHQQMFLFSINKTFVDEMGNVIGGKSIFNLLAHPKYWEVLKLIKNK